MPDGNILTYHYQGENVSQIDLNGQILSSPQWEQGQEIRRHMERFGELTCRHQFDECGRLRQQTLQLHQTLSKSIERRYDYNVVGELTGSTTTSISSQIALKEFESALNIAIKQNGIVTDKMIHGGN